MFIILQKQIKLKGHKANIVDPLKAKLPLLDKRFVEYQKSKLPENIKRSTKNIEKALTRLL